MEPPRLHPAPRIRILLERLAVASQRHPRLAAGLEATRDVLAAGWHLIAADATRRNRLLRQLRMVEPLPPTDTPGPRVLMVSPRFWQLQTALDVTLANALRLRGCEVHVFYCGGGQRICEMGWPARDARLPCDTCSSHVAASLDAAGLVASDLDSLVPEAERQELTEMVLGADDPEALTVDGIELGEAIRHSLIWRFRTTDLAGEEHAAARRDFLVGAAILATAAGRLLDRQRPDVVVMLNGLFYEEKIFFASARRRGMRCVTYEGGHRPGTFVFAHGPERRATDYDISELWEEVRDVELAPEEHQRVAVELAGRRSGAAQSQRYFSRTRPLDIGGGSRRIVMFTNVAWDSAVIDSHRAFSSMHEWIDRIIELAEERPSTELVVRAHPAEKKYKLETRTAQPVIDHIRARGPVPANVTLIAPEDPVDSYSLVDQADVVAVYTSTVGAEAAAAGKPVWVAGAPHYGQRGFTEDALYPDDLVRAFDGPLPDAAELDRRRTLARRYLHAFLFRACIPISAVTLDDLREVVIGFERFDDLRPGFDPGLDVVLDGIVTGSPFIVPRAAG